MPEHLKGFGVAEHFIGTESHVEGRDFADLQVPGHLAVLAHPFGMFRSILNFDMAMGPVFR